MFEEKCCKQCRPVRFEGTITKWPVQKQNNNTKSWCKPEYLKYSSIIFFVEQAHSFPDKWMS